MKLSEKILTLRKQNGLSQEDLAEKLDVSRQAVSRWEIGSAQPDASNILHLSKLFGVTADYLLNDEYKSDRDVPAVIQTQTTANKKTKNIIALCVSAFGLFGNFIFYLLSRFIEVNIPHITYEGNGKRIETWIGGIKGRSYKYFIWEYNLEFLTILFWGLVLAGLIYIAAHNDKVKKVLKNCKENLKKHSKTPKKISGFMPDDKTEQSEV